MVSDSMTAALRRREMASCDIVLTSFLLSIIELIVEEINKRLQEVKADHANRNKFDTNSRNGVTEPIDD